MKTSRFLPILLLCLLSCGREDPPVTPVANPVPVTGLSISPQTLSLFDGETAELKATVSPGDASNQLVDWSSSAPEIASVSGGIVLAKAAGEAAVTARSRDGGFTAICTVRVETTTVLTQGATEIDAHSALLEGSVRVAPSNRAGVKAGFRYSRDAALSSFVEVSAPELDEDLAFSLRLESLEPASTYFFQAYATVYGKTFAGEILSFETGGIPVSSIQISPAELTLAMGGNAVALSAAVLPEDATNQALTWSSSDASVATVSEGVVTPKGVGTATITASAGQVKGTCTVTVCQLEAVDLGLSVKWANMNVGAAIPSGSGEFFAWGETLAKTNYNWGT